MNVKNNYASVDIGGTNVRFAIVEENKITKKIRFQTNQLDYKKTLDKLISYINKYQIDNLALCIPGPANYEEGIIISSPNLKGWTGVNVKQYLLENTQIKQIIFENDANAMALANHNYYSQGEKDVTQFFTVSTGFGAGLVINNKIFTGSNYLAQEIARIPLGVNANDHFHLSPFSAESFISGTGIALRATKMMEEKISTKEAFELYDTNEKIKTIINDGIMTLAKTIATSIAFLNPNLIVFGGSVTIYNKWYIKEAIKLAKEFTDKSQYKNVKFRFDRLKDNSALVGLNYLLKK